MEVKHGYKQTEVGIIPGDWQTPKVGDVCGCIVPGRNKPKVFDGNIPWITTPDLENGKAVITSRIDLCISHAEAKSVGSKIVPPGSVLMSCAGELGIVALTQNEIVVNQQLHVFIPTDRIDGRYLLGALAFRKDTIANYGTKTAVPYLNKNACNSILIPLPPLPEQRVIAEVLSDVDELLGGLIAKKRDLKQAAMQQLLIGQIRLPGFHGEWEVGRLGQLTEMGSGGTPPSSVAAYYDGDIPWTSISDMTKGGKVILSTDRNLTPVGFRNCAAQMFPTGTVLYAMYASLGECSIAGIPLCSSQAILGIRPKEGLNGEFLYYFLASLRTKVKTLGQQGTQANLNKGMVQDFILPLPSLPEQTAIVEVLTEMDAELAALEQRREKTRDLKQAMMQELLTGRTRLITLQEAHA
jgi:type I restriction enzyme S subunit